MRVTKWGEYGILICLYLAGRLERSDANVRDLTGTSALSSATGAAEISQSQSIPIQYTQQILQRLRKGGVVKSVRGPKGGYQLSRKPQEISLKDIFYAAEGDTFEVFCDRSPVYTDRCEGQMDCGLHGVWNELKEAVDAVLEKRTLASVFEQHRGFYQHQQAQLLVPAPHAHGPRETATTRKI